MKSKKLISELQSLSSVVVDGKKYADVIQKIHDLEKSTITLSDHNDEIDALQYKIGMLENEVHEEKEKRHAPLLRIWLGDVGDGNSFEIDYSLPDYSAVMGMDGCCSFYDEMKELVFEAQEMRGAGFPREQVVYSFARKSKNIFQKIMDKLGKK